MRARLGSGLRRLKSRFRGRTDVAPGTHVVSLDSSGHLHVSGDLGSKGLIDAVVIKSRVSNAEILLETPVKPTYEVSSPVGHLGRGGASSFDIYLSIRSTSDTQARLVRVRAPHRATSEVLSKVVYIADRPTWLYATQDGFVAIRLDLLREPRINVRMTNITSRGTKLTFNALLTARNIDAEQAYLEVAVRSQDHVVTLPLTFLQAEGHPTKYQTVHRVSGIIDAAELLDRGIPIGENYLDVAVVLDHGVEERLRRRLTIPGDVKSFRKLRPLAVDVDGQTQTFIAYATFKGSNLAITAEVFDTETYRYMHRLSRLGLLWSLIRPLAGVWIVGETAYKAQDAGYHYFEWVRKHHPKRRVYFVLSSDSPELDRVQELGNVLTIRSRKHILHSFLASRIATTHDSAYVLPTSDPSVLRWMRGTRIFLQHGVTGTKNITKNYGRKAHIFYTDFVHVSSARERETYINDFGYRPRQVRVTGLSRFDALMRPLADKPSGLLVIPTWRDWLMNAEEFEQSEYLRRWRGMLESEHIQAAIEQGLRVTLILHPNMRNYVHHFDVPGIFVINQGEMDVQYLMRSHQAMVTDYSSVGFDFAFQRRPVIYYQFDREKFIGSAGSHLDLDRDLPGQIVRHHDDLIDAVLSSWRAGFVMQERFEERVLRSIKPPSLASYSEQVHASILTARSWRIPLWRLRDSARGRLLYRRFRGHRFYPRVMSTMAAFGRLLPRRNLVVFESNTGRSVSDSPHNIYEHLVASGANIKMVWSTSSTFRPTDLATRKVEPGSPSFHWLMSRAKYWVNNQNFGPMVKPAKGTTYVQTWHGTPLKKMQFDAVSTTGRNEGYLDRMAQKTATWSVLLSPSRYASDAFRSAFRYDGEILESGYPRNDILVNNPIATGKRVRQAWGIPANAKVVLYAPTFRDDIKDGARYAWSDAVDWPTLLETLPEETVILVRKHSIVRGKLGTPEDVAHRIIDVSAHPETQTLLCAADVLVTDYSSIMFDYAILDRPIILHCYDLDHYRSELRGFYFDIEEETPGHLTKTTAEFSAALSEVLNDLPQESWAEPRRRFRERFAPLDDGKATERVVRALFGNIKGIN